MLSAWGKPGCCSTPHRRDIIARALHFVGSPNLAIEKAVLISS
jgi:hypothetical protein